jgi:hypothetical protein
VFSVVGTLVILSGKELAPTGIYLFIYLLIHAVLGIKLRALLAVQALYHLSHGPSPFALKFVFQAGSHAWWEGPQTVILIPSPSE